MAIFSLDDQTDTDLSLSLVSLSGWLNGPSLTRKTTALPNMLGVAASSFGFVEPKQISYSVKLECATLAERETKLAAYYDAIAGLKELVFIDKPTRVIRVISGPVVVSELATNTHFFDPRVIISSTFISLDGVSYDIEPSLVKFGSTPTAVIPGTLPSPGTVFLTGAQTTGTARVITYRSFNGIAYGSMTITPTAGESLGANDYLELSLTHRTITKVSAGVRTSVYHWKAAGLWFTPQPTDCDRPRAAYPTLETSTGEGVYAFRPAWSL